MWRDVEKGILLDRLDHHWKEHLATLDALRQVVFLRAYAQKQPINEYKHEAFRAVRAHARDDPRGRDQGADDRAVPRAAAARVRPARAARLPHRATSTRCSGDRAEVPGGVAGAEAIMGALGGAATGTLPRPDAESFAGHNVSRNAPCPCGSGQKYKHCHGVA
jgi:preprotein translocase subunit SecA